MGVMPGDRAHLRLSGVIAPNMKFRKCKNCATGFLLKQPAPSVEAFVPLVPSHVGK
jgi:hypothetical protein